MAKNELGSTASFFYILGCVLSMGGLWFMKIVVQKAIIDAK